ncbi:hypothetical protein [Metabacillus fastidiosus]|uniref:hypothetical protein n=1 Tax=Metabacillus fastidiosus TaxID=1458 RepID=UPI002DB55AB5|nr:hypothetical protein [Metabacillus fastidiosus]MEC2077143.1 hypothetical protein [Metabacillus fastidiosus]
MPNVVIGGLAGAHFHGGFAGSGLSIGRPFIMYYPPSAPSSVIIPVTMNQPFFNPYLPYGSYGYGYPPFSGYY